MDHEIRLTTYSEFTIPAVVPEVPRRQKLSVDPDINDLQVSHALATLHGLEPHESAYIVCSEHNRDHVLPIAQKYRLPLILLPPEMLHNAYAWAIVAKHGSVYSVPTY